MALLAAPLDPIREGVTMFTSIRSVYGALGVMLALVALFLLLDKAGGAAQVIRAISAGGVDIFKTLQGRG